LVNRKSRLYSCWIVSVIYATHDVLQEMQRRFLLHERKRINMELNFSDESLKFISLFVHYWWLLIIAMIWSFCWKSVALWKSARNGSKPWFIVLLLVNTVGVLEILYIFVFGKKKEDRPVA
jgi:methionyl-tRNA synthetase